MRRTLIFLLVFNFYLTYSQIVDKKIYEGDNPFAFVNGSKPDMPVWDVFVQGFVPQANDTREIMNIDQTFSVSAGENYLIENKIVYVKPTARADINIYGTLTIRNSLLIWQQTEHQQTRIKVKNGGVLDIKDSYCMGGNQYWVNWDFESGSTIVFDNFVGAAWTTVDGSINYTSKNYSTVKMTFFSGLSNSNITITDAHHLWLELYPPKNSSFDMTFPEKRQWIDWNLINIWNNTIINITSSYLFERDLSIESGVNATIRNTPSGFSFGWAIYYFGTNSDDFIKCEIDNLGNPQNDLGQFYADTTWKIPEINSSLHIINSKLQTSWPGVYGQVNLTIRNSNLADAGVNGPSTFEVYNSKIEHFFAYTGAKAYLENCQVRNDIQVFDLNTIVYGYNVTNRDPAKNYTINEKNGGHYVALTAQGKPWDKSHITFSLVNNKLSIFPNPTNNYLYLKGNLPVSYETTVASIDGHKFFTVKRTGNKLDISTLPRGIYILYLKFDKGSFIQKFIKQ